MESLQDVYNRGVIGSQTIQQNKNVQAEYEAAKAEEASQKDTMQQAFATPETTPLADSYAPAEAPSTSTTTDATSAMVAPGAPTAQLPDGTTAPMPSFMAGTKAEEAPKDDAQKLAESAKPVAEAPKTPIMKLQQTQQVATGFQTLLKTTDNAIKIALAKGDHKFAQALAVQNEDLKKKQADAQVEHFKAVDGALTAGGQITDGYEAAMKANPNEAERNWQQYRMEMQLQGFPTQEIDAARTPEQRAAFVAKAQASAVTGKEKVQLEIAQLKFTQANLEHERKVERDTDLNTFKNELIELKRQGLGQQAELIQARIGELKAQQALEEAKTKKSGAVHGIGATSFLNETLGTSTGTLKEDQAVVKTAGAIVTANSLLTKLKDPEIRTGVQLSLQGIKNRLKSLDDTKEINDDDIKNMIEGSVEPTAKNAAFRKEALYAAFEIEKEAQGGRLTVQMMKQGGSALDPTKYTKDAYGSVIATRRKDLYKNLTEANLTDDQIETLTGAVGQRSGKSATTEKAVVPVNDENDAKTLKWAKDPAQKNNPTALAFIKAHGG